MQKARRIRFPPCFLALLAARKPSASSASTAALHVYQSTHHLSHHLSHDLSHHLSHIHTHTRLADGAYTSLLPCDPHPPLFLLLCDQHEQEFQSAERTRGRHRGRPRQIELWAQLGTAVVCHLVVGHQPSDSRRSSTDEPCALGTARGVYEAPHRPRADGCG